MQLRDRVKGCQSYHSPDSWYFGWTPPATLTLPNLPTTLPGGFSSRPPPAAVITELHQRFGTISWLSRPSIPTSSGQSSLSLYTAMASLPCCGMSSTAQGRCSKFALCWRATPHRMKTSNVGSLSELSCGLRGSVLSQSLPTFGWA